MSSNITTRPIQCSDDSMGQYQIDDRPRTFSGPGIEDLLTTNFQASNGLNVVWTISYSGLYNSVINNTGLDHEARQMRWGLLPVGNLSSDVTIESIQCMNDVIGQNQPYQLPKTFQGPEVEEQNGSSYEEKGPSGFSAGSYGINDRQSEFWTLCVVHGSIESDLSTNITTVAIQCLDDAVHQYEFHELPATFRGPEVEEQNGSSYEEKGPSGFSASSYGIDDEQREFWSLRMVHGSTENDLLTNITNVAVQCSDDAILQYELMQTGLYDFLSCAVVINEEVETASADDIFAKYSTAGLFKYILHCFCLSDIFVIFGYYST